MLSFHDYLDNTLAPTSLVAGTDENGSLTYSELRDKSLTVAQALYHQHGVKPGDRVATFMERSNDLYVVIMALSRIGAPIICLSLDYQNEEEHTRNEEARNELSPKVTITDRMGAPLTKRRRFSESLAYSDLFGVADDLPAFQRKSSETLCYNYTGGTTSASKCAEITHEMSLHELKNYPQIVDCPPHPRLLQNMSTFWGASFFGHLTIGLALQGTVCFAEKAGTDGAQYMKTIRELGINLLGCTPAHLGLLTQGNERPPVDFVICWGESLPTDLFQTYANWKIPIMNILLATEYWLSFYTYEESRRFRVLDACQVRVDGFSLDDVELDHPGELTIRGPMVFPGYVRRESPMDAHGFYSTGDLVSLASRSPITLEFWGRSNDMIKVAGKWYDLGLRTQKLVSSLKISAKDCTILPDPECSLKLHVFLKVPQDDIAQRSSDFDQMVKTYNVEESLVFKSQEEAHPTNLGKLVKSIQDIFHPLTTIMHLLKDIPVHPVTSKVDRKVLRHYMTCPRLLWQPFGYGPSSQIRSLQNFGPSSGMENLSYEELVVGWQWYQGERHTEMPSLPAAESMSMDFVDDAEMMEEPDLKARLLAHQKRAQEFFIFQPRSASRLYPRVPVANERLMRLHSMGTKVIKYLLPTPLRRTLFPYVFYAFILPRGFIDTHRKTEEERLLYQQIPSFSDRTANLAYPLVDKTYGQEIPTVLALFLSKFLDVRTLLKLALLGARLLKFHGRLEGWRTAFYFFVGVEMMTSIEGQLHVFSAFFDEEYVRSSLLCFLFPEKATSKVDHGSTQSTDKSSENSAPSLSVTESQPEDKPDLSSSEERLSSLEDEDKEEAKEKGKHLKVSEEKEVSEAAPPMPAPRTSVDLAIEALTDLPGPAGFATPDEAGLFVPRVPISGTKMGGFPVNQAWEWSIARDIQYKSVKMWISSCQNEWQQDVYCKTQNIDLVDPTERPKDQEKQTVVEHEDPRIQAFQRATNIYSSDHFQLDSLQRLTLQSVVKREFGKLLKMDALGSVTTFEGYLRALEEAPPLNPPTRGSEVPLADRPLKNVDFGELQPIFYQKPLLEVQPDQPFELKEKRKDAWVYASGDQEVTAEAQYSLALTSTMPCMYKIDMPDNLNVEALKRAVDKLQLRHSGLRAYISPNSDKFPHVRHHLPQGAFYFRIMDALVGAYPEINSVVQWDQKELDYRKKIMLCWPRCQVTEDTVPLEFYTSPTEWKRQSWYEWYVMHYRCECHKEPGIRTASSRFILTKVGPKYIFFILVSHLFSDGFSIYALLPDLIQLYKNELALEENQPIKPLADIPDAMASVQKGYWQGLDKRSIPGHYQLRNVGACPRAPSQSFSYIIQGPCARKLEANAKMMGCDRFALVLGLFVWGLTWVNPQDFREPFCSNPLCPCHWVSRSPYGLTAQELDDFCGHTPNSWCDGNLEVAQISRQLQHPARVYTGFLLLDLSPFREDYRPRVATALRAQELEVIEYTGHQFDTLLITTGTQSHHFLVRLLIEALWRADDKSHQPKRNIGDLPKIMKRVGHEWDFPLFWCRLGLECSWDKVGVSQQRGSCFSPKTPVAFLARLAVGESYPRSRVVWAGPDHFIGFLCVLLGCGGASKKRMAC